MECGKDQLTSKIIRKQDPKHAQRHNGKQSDWTDISTVTTFHSRGRTEKHQDTCLVQTKARLYNVWEAEGNIKSSFFIWLDSLGRHLDFPRVGQFHSGKKKQLKRIQQWKQDTETKMFPSSECPYSEIFRKHISLFIVF